MTTMLLSPGAAVKFIPAAFFPSLWAAVLAEEAALVAAEAALAVSEEAVVLAAEAQAAAGKKYGVNHRIFCGFPLEKI